MVVSRGDIYMVANEGVATGFEIDGDRPAIIVSNDVCNTHSQVVEVVFLTTANKKYLPTHVKVKANRQSTALCEQITSVSKERLGEYIGKVNPGEMDEIDQAMRTSLGIDGASDQVLKDECALVKDLLLQRNNEIERLKETIAHYDESKILVERDLYKKLYEDLIERVV